MGPFSASLELPAFHLHVLVWFRCFTSILIVTKPCCLATTKSGSCVTLSVIWVHCYTQVTNRVHTKRTCWPMKLSQRKVLINQSLKQTGFRVDLESGDRLFTPQQVLEHCFTFRRLTITLFLDVCIAFESVDRLVLRHRPGRSGISESFVGPRRVIPHFELGFMGSFRHLLSSPLVYWRLHYILTSFQSRHKGCSTERFASLLDLRIEFHSGNRDFGWECMLMPLCWATMHRKLHTRCTFGRLIYPDMVCALHLQNTS